MLFNQVNTVDLQSLIIEYDLLKSFTEYFHLVLNHTLDLTFLKINIKLQHQMLTLHFINVGKCELIKSTW